MGKRVAEDGEGEGCCPKKRGQAKMEHTDFLIVGGGPAGSAAGIALTRAGRTCVIVDKQRFPRVKLCGGLFTGKSQKVLQELLGAEAYAACMAAAVASREAKFSLWQRETERQGEADKSMNMSGVGEMSCMVEVMPRKEIVLIDRPKFDEWMIRHYASLGGRLIEGDAVVELDFERRVARTQSGRELSYGCLIAADGANGRIGSVVQRQGRKSNALCLEINVDRADCPDAEGVRIYFGVVPKSYAWSFVKGDKVCLGLVKLEGVEVDAQAAFRSFLQSLGVRHLENYPLRGAMLPFGNYMKVPAWGAQSVLFVGDAARLVEPLTGEGIFYALQSGVYAAQSGGDASLYIDKVSRLQRLIDKGGWYQKWLMHPLAQQMWRDSAGKHPRFIEHFYSTQIEEACLDSFLKIVWKYKFGG